MTGPRPIKTRGNRRPSVAVERDKLVTAELKHIGKSDTEIAAELGIAPSSVRRLASQGLREAMESGDQPTAKGLFNLIVTSFTEVLEKIDETIAVYEREGKLVPTRTLMAKIYAAQAIAKTCGFDTKTFVVTKEEYTPPVINITFRDGRDRQLSLPPVTDAEIVE